MLEKRFLHNLPNFIIKGPLLFIAPIEHTLKGFHFDGSNFDKKSFYVNVFFMPLYKPSQHIYLTFGRRLGDGGGDRWSTDEVGFETRLEAAMQKELPFLAGLKTALNVADALKPFLGNNPHCHEAFSYALAKAGEIRSAVDAIDTLLKLIESLKHANPKLTWELEIAERANLLKTKLTGNADIADAQLALWESETLRNLGLEAFSVTCKKIV
ncbi:MAG TPA: hypothetical protein VHQ22_12565 [Terriglobales bacterium]|nr:hypothetical protein [Terriglobales bacterium]